MITLCFENLQTGFCGKEITEGEASQEGVAIEAEGWGDGGRRNEICLPVFPLLILSTSLRQNEEFLSYQRQQPVHSFEALELASPSEEAFGVHEKKHASTGNNRIPLATSQGCER